MSNSKRPPRNKNSDWLDNWEPHDHHADFAPMNEVETIEHVWIPLSDGVRLSAKMWLPVGIETKPVPAILEIIPYRKRDSVAIRDHSIHAWLAARGYACIRPDMRGHGDSEGLMPDEYTPREQQDTVEVIEWLSKQAWCDGNVGMMGLSWGGIASMQTALHQPPALKAIIPVGASVDRYYDDGGYLVGGYVGQGLGWGGLMFGYCIRPPDPAVVGECWRDMWFERIDQTPMFVEKWMSHPLRDETWTQGSVCEAYDRINIPVLGVSGWNDCWPNTMIRLLENIDAPCRVVSGPWGHVYPNLGGTPGPRIGFLQLALEWWDFWLKGKDNGVMDAPAFLAYLQDSHPPDPHPNPRPGRWVAEERWPSDNIVQQRYGLKAGALIEGISDDDKPVTICSPVTLGLTTGEYMPISGLAELPWDQRADDAQSVCFDGEPLTERLDLLGTPRVHLRLSSDCSCGLVAARLCDVAPDGASTLISYGILNLKQRKGREVLAEVVPDQPMDAIVRLNDIGWSLKPGNRLRLALSSQLWPMAWPVAELANLQVDPVMSFLELPVRKTNAGGETEAPFLPAVAATPLDHEMIVPSTAMRHLGHDVATGEMVYDVRSDHGIIKFSAIDLEYGSRASQRYRIVEGDPLSAQIEYRAGYSFARQHWQVHTESVLTVTCDAGHFYLKGHIVAFEGDAQVHARDWDLKVPRTVF